MFTRICSSCKSKSDGNERFCSMCGEPMTSFKSSPQPNSRQVRRLDLPRLRTAQPQLVLASVVIDAAPSGGGSGGGTPISNSPQALGTVAPIVPAVSVNRSRWVRRRWYQRPRIMVPLIVLTLGVVAIGAIAYNLQRTFSTINQISTPAPEVSGAVLGGDSSITIDTGPAQAAIAAANETEEADATETPVPTEAASTATTAPVETAVPTTAPTEALTTSSSSGQLPPPPPGATATSQPESTATELSVASEPTQSESAATATDEPAQGATTDATEEVSAEVAPADETATSSAPAATSTSVPTEAPSATPTTEPTQEPTATESAPTATPSPTPIISEIERIKNNDFEGGATDWYMEAGSEIKETAAVSGSNALVLDASGSWVDQSFFFLPGTTYQLSAWGKVSKSGDQGVIGISYFGESGERLNDLEPETLTFDSSKYTQQTLRFTVPDGVATAKLYIWKNKGKADFEVDDISVRSEVAASDLEPAKAAKNDDAITILVMGVDARPGEAIDIGVRPDSLMVVRLDPSTGSCRTLAIPRDTRTELPGYGQSKINHALAVGGIPYEQQVVENLTGLKIDHYLLIDFNGFQDLVDAVGGIQIDVPEAFAISEDMSFDAGPQTMDGKHALAYARWRGGADGDFGRIARQQLVLRALIRKGAGLDVVRSLNELLPAVQDNIRTDLGATDMARLGVDYRSTCTDQSVEMIRLEGYDAWFQDPLLNLQLEYIVVDEAEVANKVAMLVSQ